MDPAGLGSFEEAKAAVEDGDAEGLGFTLTRHDPYLVVEIVNGRAGDELAPSVERVLSSFGMTFLEEGDGDDLLRAMYRGELPDELHGGEPVVVTIGGEAENYALRFFDSGWAPVTGRHIPGTPEDLQEIDQQALRRFLEKTGHMND